MYPGKIRYSEKLGLLMKSMWGSAKNAIGGLVTISLCVWFCFGLGLVCLDFHLVGEFGVVFFFFGLCHIQCLRTTKDNQ